MSSAMKPLPSVRPGSLTAPGSSKLRAPLDDRITLSEAIEIAGKIVASYPGGRKIDDAYIGALASVLGSYPASVARRAHLCPGGVPAECTSMPSPAHVMRWCEDATAPLRRRVEREERAERQFTERAERESLKQTPRGTAMTEAWLDRSDPEAARMSGQESRLKRDMKMRDEARAKLIAEIGQEAFDAIPDAVS